MSAPAPPNPVDLLRARISGLVSMTLDEVEEIMHTGTPAMKLTVARTTLPALVKILGDEQQADELQDMRDALAEVKRSIQATIADPREVSDDLDVEGDDALPRDEG